MKPYCLLIFVIVLGLGCSNKGGVDPEAPHPIETFDFEDGTKRSVSEMVSDPDCMAIVPRLLAAGHVNRGRGIKLSITDESSGEGKTIYCWSGE